MPIPLNLEKGEELGSFGRHYHKVETSKWTDTPLWPMAIAEARRVFSKTVRMERMAQILPIFEPAFWPPESVLTQEYRREGESAVTFTFYAKIGKKDMYHTVTILLGPKEVQAFTLAGRWRPETRH